MFTDTPLIIVETQAGLVEMAERLAKATVIGVDTESDSFHHYQEKVCLIQFSDLDADYILDPLSVDEIFVLSQRQYPIRIFQCFEAFLSLFGLGGKRGSVCGRSSRGILQHGP